MPDRKPQPPQQPQQSRPQQPELPSPNRQTNPNLPRTPYQTARPAGASLPATRPSLPAVTFDRTLVPAKTYTDLAELSQRLEELQARAHVLCPTLQVSAIPEFFEVAITVMVVDPDPRNGYVYDQEGDLALAKPALDKIALNANVRWYAPNCYRTDDGSDPHYCAYVVEGWLQGLDGHYQNIRGAKEVDLRDGNPTIFDPEHRHEGQVCTINCQSWRRDRGGFGGEAGFRRGWSTKRLNGAREHILALCESKAKNRAIRSLGLKSKYTREELKKPFVMPKLVLTGRSDDVELELEAKREILRSAIQASRQLFPGAPSYVPTARSVEIEPPAGLPAPPRVIEHHPPPPLPAEPVAEDEDREEPPIPIPDCGCPEGPGGVHVEGCKLFPDLEPGSQG